MPLAAAGPDGTRDLVVAVFVLGALLLAFSGWLTLVGRAFQENPLGGIFGFLLPGVLLAYGIKTWPLHRGSLLLWSGGLALLLVTGGAVTWEGTRPKMSAEMRSLLDDSSALAETQKRVRARESAAATVHQHLTAWYHQLSAADASAGGGAHAAELAEYRLLLQRFESIREETLVLKHTQNQK